MQKYSSAVEENQDYDLFMQKVDEEYKKGKDFQCDDTAMPKSVQTGFRSDLSLVPFDADVKKELKRMFGNYKSDNSPEIVPADVLKTF